jgi:hypothetical protein
LFDLNQRLISQAGDRVLDGPFRGLRLPPAAHREHVGPYLLGTYEAELFPWWDRIFLQRFAQIIDVGSNFGFYAVGLARRFPSTPVVAFDTDWWARRTTRETARANAAPNVAVRGFCSPEWLAGHLEPNALIVSDCEGAEGQLFCSRWVPHFASATFVIELHEEFVPGVTTTILDRFHGTHAVAEAVTIAEPTPRPPAWSLSGEEMGRVAREARGPQKWLLLTPRTA